MNDTILGGLVLGAGVWSLLTFRKSKNRLYLVLAVIAFIAGLGLIVIDLIPPAANPGRR